MNLYRTKDAVWFMNKRYPIARENADSIFSPLMKSANEKTGSGLDICRGYSLEE